MAYDRLLKRIIYDTGYTQDEISQKCAEIGTEVSRSYIGRLQSGKSSAPTEEVSRAIAKVCNCDERLLVIEGYLDKAPKEIRDAFVSLKYTTMLYSINVLENKVDKRTIKEIREVFEQEPLADFVIELIDNGNNEINVKELGIEIKSKDEKLICDLSKPISFKVEDNSMCPLIKENDKITIETKDRYINGDIIAISIKGQRGIIVRQAVFLGRQIELITLNKKYENKTYNQEDLTILGKVKTIITEI